MSTQTRPDTGHVVVTRRLTQEELRAVVAALQARTVRFHSGEEHETWQGEAFALSSALGKFRRDFERRVIRAGAAAGPELGKVLAQQAPARPAALAPIKRIGWLNRKRRAS